MNALHDLAPASALLDDDTAAVHVHRAQTELRQGRLVALFPGEPLASTWVLAAIETLTESRLSAMRRCQVEWCVVLTAERLHALGFPNASTARSLSLPGDVDLESLHAIAGVMPTEPHLGLLASPEPATPALQAALTLAKRARLAPALVAMAWPAERVHELTTAHVLSVTEADVVEATAPGNAQLQRVSNAHVPIAAHEDCTLVLFREIHGDAEHVAIIVGQPDLAQPVPVRLHSSCLTGDLLGSLRCDCGDQLQRAVEHLAQTSGVLLYLAQEGRGTGLASKLRAYRLQDRGLDTIDADRHLGFRGDERDFSPAVAMLQSLGINRVQLLTNNPKKIAALREAGIDVVERVALIATVNAHNARYIQTKRERAGHLTASDEQE